MGSSLTFPWRLCVFARNLLFFLFSLTLPAHATASDATAEGDLAAYVARPDPTFAWKEMSSGRVGDAEYVEYLMTSQTWRGIPWKHQFFVMRPANMQPGARHGLLFIHGGRWKAEYEAERQRTELPKEALLFARLATSIGAPIGVLRQVPFAPLFDRREDALIAYTLDQYLQTGDSEWPVLAPMVKSAVRAMDLMERASRERWGAALEAYTVSGASKRGWTAWLTAAIDSRVMAVAPMVIDVLNMKAQMEHQRETWGSVSEEIQDYAALDLPTRLGSERGQSLLGMIDPYSYRERLTQAKLILLSTNDRYWPLDALTLYWRELPAPKHVLYVPNQGHGLRDIDRVIGGLSAVHRYAAAGRPLPRTTWEFRPSARSLQIMVEPERRPERVLVWSARSASRDFRDAYWTSRPCRRAGAAYSCAAPRGRHDYTAVYAETSYQDEGAPRFSTTSTVCIAGPGGAEVEC
jgi:PhoPQ-activated pathogenicity-related protein